MTDWSAFPEAPASGGSEWDAFPRAQVSGGQQKFDRMFPGPEPSAPRFDYGATLDENDNAATSQVAGGWKAMKEATDPLNPSPLKALGGLYDVGMGVAKGSWAPATAAVRAYGTKPLEDLTGIPAGNIEGALMAGAPPAMRGEAAVSPFSLARWAGRDRPPPIPRTAAEFDAATRPERAPPLSVPGALRRDNVDMDALERAVIPDAGAPTAPLADAPEDAPRVLAPDVPHTTARASVGAAATEGVGPLSDVSPEAIKMLKEAFARNGLTNPHLLEQALDERSAHHMLGELTPGLEAEMGGINAADQGAARNEITNTVMERAKQAPERMAAAFDRAFGPGRNRAQLQRTWAAERDEASRPFWDRFRQTVVPPTPQIRALMPRLRHSGAIAAADRSMGIEGLPASQGFGPPGKAENIPTAQAFQYAKEHLDDQIEAALAKPGGENKARIFTKLKNDLVNAIDQHPDKNVAGVWKDAREVYATPTRIMKAAKLGERILTNHIHRDELPFMTASFGPQERQALAIGMRGHLEDLEASNRNPARAANRLMDAVLSQGNRQKIAAVVGDRRAEELIGAIRHEEAMHGAPTRIINGSPTAARNTAQRRYTAQPGALDNVSTGDLIHAVSHPKGTIAKAAAKVGLNRMALKREAEMTRVREEMARIMTLQGPEKNAASRALIGQPAANVYSFRASGGRVTPAR